MEEHGCKSKLVSVFKVVSFRVIRAVLMVLGNGNSKRLDCAVFLKNEGLDKG